MNVTEIQDAELLEAIQTALDKQADDEINEPGTITSSEIAEALGMSQNTAQKVAKALIAQGVLKPARIRRRNMHGVVTTVLGYQKV